MEKSFATKKFIVTRVSDPGPVFLPGLDPDPDFKYIWIRIWFSNFSGSGSRRKIRMQKGLLKLII